MKFRNMNYLFIIWSIMFSFNTGYKPEQKGDTIKTEQKEGTVIYFGKQFFFFEFKNENSFEKIKENIELVQGIKLMSIEKESYNSLIENLNCVKLDLSQCDNKNNSWDYLFYADVEVQYSYLESKNDKVKGSFLHDGVLYNYYVSDLFVTHTKLSIGKNVVNNDCKKKIKEELHEYIPGTFLKE